MARRLLRIVTLGALGSIVAAACGGEQENPPTPPDGEAGAAGSPDSAGGAGAVDGKGGSGGKASGGSSGKAGKGGSGGGAGEEGVSGEGGGGGTAGCTGPAGVEANDPCDGSDRDQCTEGRYRCTSGRLVCSDTSGDNVELCNGEDDDCDEDTVDGLGEDWMGDPCDGSDDDLCEEGRWTCANGVKTCTDTTGDSLDVCNGADDDCNPNSADGSASVWFGQDCDGDDGDTCREGTYDCIGGAQQCSDNTDDAVEVCNGSDDNCNGDEDEGLPLATCGEGLCARSGTTCDPNSCTPGTPVAELCNGLDDDCANGPDDGESNSMCAPTYPAAQNVEDWGCDLAACSIDNCLPGFADIDGQISTGCECVLDTHAADCASAAAASAVNIPRPTASTAPIIRTGTIENAGASDWFRFTFATPGVAGDAWNPELLLLGNGYRMDVQQTCDNPPPATCGASGFGGGVTEWDRRYTSFPTQGGAPPLVRTLSDTLARHTTYFVRVYLAPGAQPACNGYELRAWNL